MAYGPTDLVVVKFPGSRFSGEIAPALAELVESGTIRIIDLLFAQKAEDGSLTVVELADLDDELYEALDPVVGELAGILSEDDAIQFAGSLDPGSSVALLLFENTWAARLSEAVRNSSGQVLISERLPRSVMEELAAS